MSRNEVLDEAVAALDTIDAQCADKLNSLPQDDPERRMHGHHRQAYMRSFQALESLRAGALDFPAVAPERFQIMLCDRVIGYIGAGGQVPSEPKALMEWIKDQIQLSAEDRDRVLPL